MSQRLEFITMVLKLGTNMTQLCKQYNISRRTGYKWLHRFAEEDIHGLEDRCRCPLHNPNKTPHKTEQAVLAIRQLHPYWGGRKIKARLSHQGYKFVPAASTITAILRRNGLLDEAEAIKHTPFKRFEYDQPNQLWQMDFKGYFSISSGHCYPLTILDDHSRFSIGIRACTNEKRSTVNSYLKSINVFFNWAEKKFKINLPPRIPLVKYEKTLPKFLIPEELDRIYQLCDDEKMLSTFKIYEHTGIRLRELHSCDLDITNNGTYIKLRRTKGKRERIIPIPPAVVEDFKMAVSGGIYKPGRISKTFSKLRDKAKVSSNKTLYSLRHTFALRKLLELGNIYLVKEMLGHSSVNTTQIYLQFPDGYIKDVLSVWLPQSNEKVNQEALKLAKLLQQGGYSQSLKN